MLFDLDHPGHYFRRIKSVALSIDATVDAHTSPGATLTLTGDSTRVSTGLAPDPTPYARNAGEDTRFRDGVGGVQSIATSRGRDDAGMFELNFRDERYLPFEGAGAISRWRLELPTVRQFDYRSIGDVEVQINYTARAGGSGLRTEASAWVATRISQVISAENQTGLLLLQSAQQDFASAWERFLRPVEGQEGAPMPIPITLDKFPFIARSRGVRVAAVRLVFLLDDPSAITLPSDPNGATLVRPDDTALPVTMAAPAVVVGAPPPRTVIGTVTMAEVQLQAPGTPWEFSLGDGAIVDPARIRDLLVLVTYRIGAS